MIPLQGHHPSLSAWSQGHMLKHGPSHVQAHTKPVTWSCACALCLAAFPNPSATAVCAAAGCLSRAAVSSVAATRFVAALRTARLFAAVCFSRDAIQIICAGSSAVLSAAAFPHLNSSYDFCKCKMVQLLLLAAYLAAQTVLSEVWAFIVAGVLAILFRLG